MGKSKELFNESRGNVKVSPEIIMQELINCKNKTQEQLLMRILARIEPYNIVSTNYFELLILTPLANLKRVYGKYGYLGAGHTIRKIMSDRLSIRIMELEKSEHKLTLINVLDKKIEIAEANDINTFVFRFEGKLYCYKVGYKDPFEIAEL